MAAAAVGANRTTARKIVTYDVGHGGSSSEVEHERVAGIMRVCNALVWKLTVWHLVLMQ